MKNNSEHLNDLLEYLYDSFNGLNECADQAKSIDFKNYLLQVAKIRQNYIAEIKSLWDNHDTQPVDKGSMLGPLHRLYIDIKAKMSSDNNQAIKEEILRGDKTLIEKYNETIKEVNSKEMQKVLSQQLNNIHASLVEITTLANS